MKAFVGDAILPEAMALEIEQVLLGFRFPWHYYPNTNARDLQTNAGDAPQFVHGFIQNEKRFSQYANVPEAIIERMGLPKNEIIRAKANILGRDREPLVHPAHTDDQEPHWVLIYYVNDSDGDTCLFEGDEVTKRITPKRGRVLVFDGSIRHASSSPVETPFRCVFNFNLKPTLQESQFEKLLQKVV